jgi:tetratricopeptide (TPR) repeat protein
LHKTAAILLCLTLTACGGGNEPAPNEPAQVNAPANRTSKPSASSSDFAKARELFDEAGKLSLENRNSSAAELLERAIALSPDDAEIHERLGHAYAKLLRYEEARDQFLLAATLADDNSTRRELRGRAAWCYHVLAKQADAKGDHEVALREAEHGLELDPDNHNLHMLAGFIHVKNAAYAKAAAAFEAAVMVSAGAQRHEALAWQARAEFDGGDFNAARRTYTVLINEGVEGREAYAMRAYCNVQTSRKDEAINDFIEAIARTDDTAKRAEYEDVLKQLRELKDPD